MALTDDEALGLKKGQMVSMGKRIFTVTGYETTAGFKEPVLVDEKGDRLSSVLFVAHILHHYVPPVKKAEEPKEGEVAAPALVEPVPDEEF